MPVVGESAGAWSRTAAAVLLAVLAAGPGPAAAQGGGPEPEFSWTLKNLKAGYCLQFLFDPKAARDLPFAPGELVPLSAAAVVHPSLARVARESPEYASWIPSSICTYQFESTQRGGRVQRDSKGTQGVAIWRVAPAAAGGLTPADVMITHFELARQLREPSVRLNIFRASIGKVPETGQDLIVTRIGKTTITFVGTLEADSSATPVRFEERWSLHGSRNSVWSAAARIEPTEARLMVGSIRVEGKTHLARMLQASPIRWTGALYRGGDGEISFYH
jgi:hypothetical protein